LDFEGVKTTIVRLFPPKYQKEAVHVISVIDREAGAYLRGNLIRCSVVGLTTWLGLSLLGMPFALILGITAGLLNIIYNIGPFMAAIPAVLISFTPGTPHPLLVIALYIIIQMIDPFILTPFLMGKAVDLRPITVVIAILCGARLMGLLGIIIAIPLTAIVKVLLNHYYLQKMNNGHCVETKITAHKNPTSKHS
jgi:predicted PurR-regulated permease PerM